MQRTDTLNNLFNRTAHNPSFEQVRSTSMYEGEIHDFCVPVNTYFPPPQMIEAIKEKLPDLLKYYPDYSDVHQDNIAAFIGIPAQNIVVSNGSTEIITSLCRDLAGAFVTDAPTFGRWTDLPMEFGVPVNLIQRRKEANFKLDAYEIIYNVRRCNARSLVISNPSNPTGAWLTIEDVRQILTELRDLDLIAIDESFIDFSGIESASNLVINSENAIVVKSMGKSIGWHGVRLGYAVAGRRWADELRLKSPYWNINGLAAFVLKNLAGYRQQYLESFHYMRRDRDYMMQRLATVPYIKVYPSRANFVYCELLHGVSGKAVQRTLLSKYGMFVRECSNKIGASEAYLRLAVHSQEVSDQLAQALAETLTEIHEGVAVVNLSV